MKPKCYTCRYSKQMNQSYPRICIDCSWPEDSVIDHEYYKSRDTGEITIDKIALALNWIHRRNHYTKIKLYDPEGFAATGEEYLTRLIRECNENIRTLLNL